MPPILTIHRAVVVPPERRGKPFHLDLLLPHELPMGAVLVNPIGDVVELYVDDEFRTVGRASTIRAVR
jgi:hypothetical protein